MRAGIAGAGIMGQLMAFMLVNDGWDVTLFDPLDAANCSHAAAGLLTPYAELEKCGEQICEMGLEALHLRWPEILKQLDENIYFRTEGSILISHSRDDAEMSRFIDSVSEKRRKENEITLLSHDDLMNLEPQLGKFPSGFLLRHEGQIDNQQFLLMMKKYLLRHQVRWKKTGVTEIDGGGIIADKQRFKFDLHIDCRGMGAKTDIAGLRGIRGELIWLHAPQVSITRPVRLAHPRYAVYIVPRPEHIYLVGASEIEAEDYSAISVQTTLELLSAAYSIHSGFSEARVIKTVTQCRPTLAHHLPQVMVRNTVISINGLYRHGFLIAPALAHDVMQYIQRGISALTYPHIWEQAA